MTHVSDASRYVSAVIAGEIPACRWVKLACQRHLRDLERAESPDFPFRFDAKLAEKACKFAELMPHTKGKWCRFNHESGEWNTIKLEGWQKFVLCSLFGWVRKSNGKRRFAKASLYIPRKNAKSTLAACIGLFMLVMDDEAGAEVYSGATTQKQAMEVFKVAWLMVKKNPELADRYGIVVSGDKSPARC